MSVHPFVFTAEQLLRIDLLRSIRLIRLAESIFQFETGRHAKLTDLAPPERRRYHELAQHVSTLLEKK